MMILPGVTYRKDRDVYRAQGSGPRGTVFLWEGKDLFEAICRRKSYEAAWAAMGVDKTKPGKH